MSNEIIFLLHVATTMAFSLAALALGQGALTAAVVVQAVFANLFVLKQITLFGFSVTAADAYIVGCMFCTNFLQEFYSKSAADKATWAFVLGFVWYVAASWIHLSYVPLASDWAHGHFVPLLRHVPRLVFASLVAMFSSMRLNNFLFKILSTNFFGSSALWLKNFISVVIAQGFDTTVFAFLGLYGLVESVWQIILVATAVKLITIALASPIMVLARQAYKLCKQF